MQDEPDGGDRRRERRSSLVGREPSIRTASRIDDARAGGPDRRAWASCRTTSAYERGATCSPATRYALARRAQLRAARSRASGRGHRLPRRASAIRTDDHGRRDGGLRRDAIRSGTRTRSSTSCTSRRSATATATAIGDFRGLIEKLDYIAELGVDGGLAAAVLSVAAAGRRLRHRRLRGDPSDATARRRLPARSSTRRTRAGSRSSPSWSSTTPRTSTPGSSARGRAPKGSPERDCYVWSDDPNKYAGRAHHLHRHRDARTGPGIRWRSSSTGTASSATSPTSTSTTRRCSRRSSTSCASGCAWGWTGCGSTRFRTSSSATARTARTSPRRTSVLKKLRAALDAEFTDRVFLAEANQWPDDVRPYFGDGDECHMAFHFPVMPRMYMALRAGGPDADRRHHAATPPIPADCQWAIFLRNHDELTLEMVTDEERDYMYGEYATRPAHAHQRRHPPAPRAAAWTTAAGEIELMNALLHVAAGHARPLLRRRDRHGRQHLPRRPQRRAHADAVERRPQRRLLRARTARRSTAPSSSIRRTAIRRSTSRRRSELPTSLLRWMRRLIVRLRRQYHAFGRGTFEPLDAGEPARAGLPAPLSATRSSSA